MKKRSHLLFFLFLSNCLFAPHATASIEALTKALQTLKTTLVALSSALPQPPSTSSTPGIDQKLLKKNMSDIVARFRKEIKSSEITENLSKKELTSLFPCLIQEKDAAQKINDFIQHFAGNTKTIEIPGKIGTHTLYAYPSNNPVLTACSCSQFTLGERLLITFKQLDDIINYYPNKTQQIVHTSFAAGGAEEKISKLLQLFMFIRSLLDFGYQNIVVKPIDNQFWSPGDMMNSSLLKEVLHKNYDNIDIYCVSGFNKKKEYKQPSKTEKRCVVILAYDDAKKCTEQIAKGAPRSDSFDIIDFTVLGENREKARASFVDCIKHTAVDNNVIIYEGYNNKIYSYEKTNLVRFMNH